MATYAEIASLIGETNLQNKVAVACIIAAEAIRTESDQTPNHTNRLLWARQANRDPQGTARQVMPSLLAQNAGFTLAQIQGATDAAIQTAVNNAINIFATGD